ncbi:MAG: diacylglycerol kinase family lipid kinase [Lactobacillus sp.]|jgi:YegS/Rv2252/BmrU family lipid kinase|nr:diacylglycerol kinase family lipid kinase [Lactobacillus sp.]
MLPYYFHVIANETAGSFQGKKTTQRIIAYLTAKGSAFHLEKTQYPKHATLLAQNINPLKDAYQHIVLVIGGDGTLHQVIKGLLANQHTASPIPIGYIPSGTGNDFSRGVNLGKDPIENMKLIETTRQARELDVGVMTDPKSETSVFINNLGIGIDARTVFLTNRSKAKAFLSRLKMGSMSYLANLLKAYRQQKTFNITFRQNNKTYAFNDIFLVTFGNEPYFGGGVPILPNANVTNHLIDLILVEKMSFAKLVPLFYKMLTDGSHLKNERVHYFQSAAFHLKTDRKEYGQIDGEELGFQQFDYKISLTQYPFWF